MPGQKKEPERKQAVALKYNPKEDIAPKVTAKGKGLIAEKIIQMAKESGIPIHEDADLIEILSSLDLEDLIPSELYQAVAQILAFVYNMNKTYPNSPPKANPTGQKIPS